MVSYAFLAFSILSEFIKEDKVQKFFASRRILLYILYTYCNLPIHENNGPNILNLNTFTHKTIRLSNLIKNFF